jgi:hypothetical protein
MSPPRLAYAPRRSLLTRLFVRAPDAARHDFSEIRRRSQLLRAWTRSRRRVRPDPVKRLTQEVRRYQAEEFRLEQVTALRQIAHLLPLAERELPQLKPRRAARAAEIIQLARGLPDAATLRHWPVQRR